MGLNEVLYEALAIFKLVFPPMFIGMFLSNILRLSPYFKHIGRPLAKLASLSNLPPECSNVLTMFFVNNWATLAMLSDIYRRRLISDKEVIVTMLVGFLPKGLHIILFFMAPIAFSVLGFSIGMTYILIEFSIYVGITLVGIALGRFFLRQQTSLTREMHYENIGWWNILKISLKESITNFRKTIIILTPTVIVVLFLLDFCLLDSVTEICEPILHYFGIPASGIVVIAASIMSQMAAISAVGALLASGLLSPLHCLVLLFIAHFIHMGIGCIRVGLPMNVSLFGKSLGLKATVISYSMLELGTAIAIVFLCFL